MRGGGGGGGGGGKIFAVLVFDSQRKTVYMHVFLSLNLFVRSLIKLNYSAFHMFLYSLIVIYSNIFSFKGCVLVDVCGA